MRPILICIFLLVSFSINGCKGFAYRNTTTAMAPAMQVDDAFTVNPYEYSSHPIERFDIVVHEAPDERKIQYQKSGDWRFVKRVIGLPGEKIEIKENQVFINDILLVEPFEKIIDENDRAKDFPAMVIPEGEYFLMGDNRPNSDDSRRYQHPTIKKENIFGKLVDIYPGYYKK